MPSVKYRLIVDLSAPEGFSVNDGILPNLCSLQYVLVEQAARLVATAGIGALMAKIDHKSVYRHIPVHPADQHLLGIQWNDVTYIDRALLLSLCSAPKLFTAIADAWLGLRGAKGSIIVFTISFFRTSRFPAVFTCIGANYRGVCSSRPACCSQQNS